jgi:UDP-N-acetylglucosamine 2-epimerase (non-hydrolysing)
MKMAPIVDALRARGHHDWFLVHTGQHYDDRLSKVFLDELGLPEPDVSLRVGSGSHAQQTADVMLRLEPVLIDRKPDMVVVVGDVNSTMASALVAAKLGIRLAHVEAGLRSGDRSMPEEVNRIVTDVLADVLFTTSADAGDNLIREGIAPAKIHCVGNVMADSLLRHLPEARHRELWSTLGVSEGRPDRYAVLTLHRPSNVDDPGTLSMLMDAVRRVAERLPVVFPVHPRTATHLRSLNVSINGLWMVEPLGYLDFLALTSGAALILTDSGGLQEEATILGVPCLTLRENTERPVTVTHGTNRVVGTDPATIAVAADDALTPSSRAASIPALWDGQAAGRIVDILMASSTR